MSPRLAAAATLAVLTISGCSTNSAPTPSASAQGPVAPRETTATTRPLSPEQQRLADQTAAYVDQVRQAGERKLVITPAVPTAAKAAAFPDVQWLQPDLSFTLGPKQEDTPPAALISTPTSRPAVAVATTPPAPAAVTAATPTVDPLEQRLTQQARDYPRDLAAHLDHQLLMLLAGQRVPQMDAIAGLAREDRELVHALMDGLSNLRAAAKDGQNLLLSQKVRPLLDMAERLRSQSELRVPTVALCSEISGFGVYAPLRTGAFPAGKEHGLVLYCEVENFESRVNDNAMWETNLTQQLTITNEKGAAVYGEKARPVSDLARRRRNDFFLGQRVRLPSTLPPGKYKLTVTVTDAQSNRVAEGKTDLELIATPNK